LFKFKEQDPIFSTLLRFITKPIDSLMGMTVEEAFDAVEIMINDFVDDPVKNKRLLKYAPGACKMFLKLNLNRALKEFDEKTNLLSRVFVPPTFKEIRLIFARSIIHAFAPEGKLVTFDADDTIYEDGGTVSSGSPMEEIMYKMLERGLFVALCTAAGYPGNHERYEERLKGILDGFKARNISSEMMSRFMVMGGECNYLLKLVNKLNSDDGTDYIGLEYVDESLWKDGRGVRWSHDDVKDLLDTAEEALKEVSSDLCLPVRILRKERAIGLINESGKRFSYELLEETALSVQYALRGFSIPHCAFNGGNDVWVDVGNKALGVRALQAYFGVSGSSTMHVGDRFTQTGNDAKAREVANTLWVSNPQETLMMMQMLLDDIDTIKHST
jgi:IMP and pyridine-specific 5'-nucleotidase